MTRTFRMYAGDIFLGYEYAEDSVEAIVKTRQKFGAHSQWSIEEYTADIIRWREENATT